jgi:hypothetical protein
MAGMRFRRGPHIDTGQINENWQPKLYIRLALLVVLIAYVIAFVLENRKAVPLHFVLFTAHVSLIWLILLMLGIGVAGGVLLSQLYRRRRGH